MNALGFGHAGSEGMGSARLTNAGVAGRAGLARHTLRYCGRDGLMPGAGQAGS
jgi:hypothetical protein